MDDLKARWEEAIQRDIIREKSAREFAEKMQARQAAGFDAGIREQTAAWILAALIQAPDDVFAIPPEKRSDAALCRYAVDLTDMLRVELAKTPDLITREQAKEEIMKVVEARDCEPMYEFERCVDAALGLKP